MSIKFQSIYTHLYFYKKWLKSYKKILSLFSIQINQREKKQVNVTNDLGKLPNIEIKKCYVEDENTSTSVKMPLVSTFLPSHEVGDAFDDLVALHQFHLILLLYYVDDS